MSRSVLLMAMVMVIACGCAPVLREPFLRGEHEVARSKRGLSLEVHLPAFRQWLDQLPVAPSFSALALSEGPSVQRDVLNFCVSVWRSRRTCYSAAARDGGLTLFPPAGERNQFATRMILEQVDPGALEALDAAVSEDVEADLEKDVGRTVGAWSGWLQAGAIISAGAGLDPGLTLRGGVRRWLSPFLLISAGPTWESRFLALPRHSLGLSARIELSHFDVDESAMKRRLNVPLLSGYFGLSATVGFGVEPLPTLWRTRLFAGLQLLFLFIETGASVEARGENSTPPLFYLSVGFGI